jgi:hypothetical protein
MLRGFLSLVVGVFAAMITITFVEAAGAKIWPPPEGFDFSKADLAEVKAFIDTMSLAAKSLIVAGWLAGCFVGGLVATLVARHATRLALVPGVLIAAATIANAMMLPHPRWMPAVGVLLALPMAWLGGRLGVRFVRAKPEEVRAWKGGSK